MAKIGRISSNERIPMSNIFNRTPFFIPVERKELNIKINENKPFQYKDKHYSLEMHGSKLSHRVDYPLLALIIKHWLNARNETGSEQNSIRIPLSDIHEVIAPSIKSGNKEEGQQKIKSSLIRLNSAVVCFSSPKKQSDEMISILSYAKLDYKNKWVDVEVSKFLTNLYDDLSDISALDCSYVNVDDIYKAPSETSKALMKYFMTHHESYIDFKLDRIVQILGYQFKDKFPADKVIRKRVKDALDELMGCGFLTVYGFDQAKGWDTIRIIPKTLCANFDKAVIELSTRKSNFKDIKFHYYKKKINIEIDKIIPF
jgi:hypothetical protein